MELVQGVKNFVSKKHLFAYTTLKQSTFSFPISVFIFPLQNKKVAVKTIFPQMHASEITGIQTSFRAILILLTRPEMEMDSLIKRIAR